MRVAMIVPVVAAVVLAGGCGGGSRSSALEVCARVSACGVGGSSFGELCNAYVLFEKAAHESDGTEERLAAALMDCVEKAADCGAVQQCVIATAAEAAVCGNGNVDKCSGDVLVECDGTSTPDAFDCAAAGLICGETANGAACGTASCDPATTLPSCDGHRIVRCEEDGNVLVVKDCRYESTIKCSGVAGGMTCNARVGDVCAIVDGKAECVGSGEPCDEATFSNRCEGTVMVTCSGGKIGTRDCAALDPGLTCMIGNHGATQCSPLAQECDEHTPETCEKGVITFCLLGKVTTVDCVGYGLSGCTTVTVDGATVARCTE